ncbi:TPM domain-containing protein [Sphaerotilus sp.]|uniref:TPM domain-containing protein n=1 Tax=Sphaerotilus sp. TaxID=2093942 RepID=UPI0025EC3123|nr:TPM domain-containing protein [Sphaerotilus sp.]
MTTLLRGLLTLGLWLLVAFGSAAQDILPVPPLNGRVIDQTGTLQPGQRQALTTQLETLEREAGSQVVVLLVRSTQPEDIAAYAQRVGDAWKIGRRTVGDGLLIVVATQDRKVRIEVAKTLEGAIPDLMAKRVINEQVTPAFRQGDYAGGLSSAVRVLGGLIKGEGLPAPSANGQNGTGQDSPDPMMWILLTVVMLPMFAKAIVGVFGRKLGPLLTGAGAGGVTWLMTASLAVAGMAAVVGLVVALVVGLLGFVSPGVTRGRSFPSPGGWGGGGGGWGGGGSSGGGGFSSGGGGDFGGGGASGSW